MSAETQAVIALVQLRPVAGVELAELTEAQAAVARAEAARDEQGLPPSEADFGPYVDVLVDQFRAGDPDAHVQARELLSLRQDLAVEQEAARLLGGAVGRLQAAAVSVARSNAATCLTELQQRHAEVLAEARSCYETLSAAGVDPREQRDAWAEPLQPKLAKACAQLVGLAKQRDTLGHMVEQVRFLAGWAVQSDVPGLFATYEHPERLDAAWMPGGPRRLQLPPLPPGGLGRLWLLVGECWSGDAWLPSPQQRDARWSEVLGDQVDSRRNKSELIHAIGR